MPSSFFEKRLAPAGVFFLCTGTLAIAATLRVPEDFDRIQRAIHASSPGDTIVVGAGTYYENLSIDDALTLRGAGVGKTILMAPDRQSPAITADFFGPIVIADLTISHTPRPRATEPAQATAALSLSFAPVTVRNVALKDTAYSGIASLENQLVMSDVTIGPAWGGALDLRYTLPGTRFDRVVIERVHTGPVIEVHRGAAAFRDVTFDFGERQGIEVSGPDSAARFENITPAVRALIEWEDRASPDGPVAFEPDIVEKTDDQEREEAKTSRTAFKEMRDARKPARRKLARDLETALRSATTAEKAAVVVADYFAKLYATTQPEDYDDAPISIAVASEMRAFQDRFGGLALVDAVAKFPARSEGDDASSYIRTFTFDMDLAIERERADQWVKTSIADLPQVLATWKDPALSTPAAQATAFLAMLKTVSVKSEAGSDAVKGVLREAGLNEFSRFIEARGYSAVDELLRQTHAAPTSLFTLDDLRAHLTAANTRALVQFWKTQK